MEVLPFSFVKIWIKVTPGDRKICFNRENLKSTEIDSLGFLVSARVCLRIYGELIAQHFNILTEYWMPRASFCFSHKASAHRLKSGQCPLTKTKRIQQQHIVPIHMLARIMDK
uniref:Uncharacterized protein n=1 Tax=Glossina palpalis gambiensis TaxID=67801 RepID=A0A1B0AU27_9MUSC